MIRWIKMREQVESDPLWREIQEVVLSSDFVTPVKTYKSWLPRKCRLSGKNLFGRQTTKLKRHVPSFPNGPATGCDIRETYWVCDGEYTLLLLKGPPTHKWISER